MSSATIAGGPDSHAACNHEYGHLLSNIIREGKGVSSGTKQWFERIRSCLAQGYDDRNEDREEEDFADVLAFSFTNAGARTFCGMIPDVEQAFTLKNWHSKESRHSGNLYRVLHARVLNGEGIPPTCKAALTAKGENPFERNCLKETQSPKTAVR